MLAWMSRRKPSGFVPSGFRVIRASVFWRPPKIRGQPKWRSLDVIFHLVEDDTFQQYMGQLFDHALRFVVIYSSNYDAMTPDPHVRHRRFSDWVEQRAPDWQRVLHVPNPYPFDPHAPEDTSFADFHVFARVAHG
jgi:hypothetical protein